MSFFGDATVEIHIDAGEAEKELGKLLSRASKQTATVNIEADTRKVGPAVESAIGNAKAQTRVQADASGVTKAINEAIPPAPVLPIRGDARNIRSRIESEIKGADTRVRVSADAPGLASIGEQLDGIGEKGESAADRVVAAFKPTPGKIAALLGGLVVAAGVEYNSLVQRTTAAFDTLLGSASDASAKVAEVADFARSSPFPRQVFLEATQQLLAFGVEAGRTTEVLGAVQDAVAAVGGDASLISEVVNVLSEIKSTGDISAETLNQLGIRGINAAKIIATEMGTTEQAIREGVTDGTLDADAAFDALVSGMSEQFGGAAENLKSTWLGAVDGVKAALRDLGSAIVDPFISKSGGGAAVDFANSLEDALRRLEARIVPLVQQVSGSLAPGLRAVGTDLLPALVDAFVALTPALGQASTAAAALAPAIGAISAVIRAIPDPLLSAVGAFILIRRVLGPLSGLFNIVTSALSRVVVPAGSVSGAFNNTAKGATGLRGAFAGIAGAITPATLALTAATIGFAAWSDSQAKAAEASRRLAESQKGMREALRSTEGSFSGLKDHIEEVIEAQEKLALSSSVQVFANFADIGTVSEAFQGAGASVDGFTRAMEQGGPAVRAYLGALKEDAPDPAAVTVLASYAQEIDGQAKAALKAGVATDDWSESERKAAIEQTRAKDGTANYSAAIELLNGKVAAQKTAQEKANTETEQANAALTELATKAPIAGLMLQRMVGVGSRIGSEMNAMASAMFDAGASEEALTAAAAQLGVDAQSFIVYTQTIGQHIQDLRADILEGLPALPDIFGDASEDVTSAQYVATVALELEHANNVIEQFKPNLDALIPWPHLREQAARQGPEVAEKYAEQARAGNTAILDQTDAGVAEYGLRVAGFSGAVNQWAPGFVSSLNIAGFLGGQALTTGFTPSLTPGFQNVETTLAGGSIVARDHALQAGAGAGQALTRGFQPSAAPGMAPVPGQITQPGVPAIAGAEGSAAGTQFGQAFNPDVSAAMLGISTQISGWGPVFNGTLGLMGAGAAGAFTRAFTPNPGPALLSLAGGLSGWGPVINGTMGVLGQGGTSAFNTNFAPSGGGAMLRLSAGISGWGSVLNGTMMILAQGAASSFMAHFAPDPGKAMMSLLAGLSSGALKASAAFGTYFRPNPQPALARMLAEVTAASFSLQRLMTVNMGQIPTRMFMQFFRPDPRPALNRMLAAARGVIAPLAQAGRVAGSSYVQYLTRELSRGANSVLGIVRSYASRLASGLNPILAAIGKPKIALRDGAVVRFADGGITNFANGGMRERHVAQIAPAGAMRVWAEPETGGEAYIPLAKGKRERSRKIAAETVDRLGGRVNWYARGGVTGDVVGLDPRFFARLNEWSQALGQRYTVTSGFRSLAEQQRLYARYQAGVAGQAPAAVPGSSMHNFGLAADGDRWRGRNPGAHGLRYPMSYEPWHVEPNEARQWARGLPGAGLFVNLPAPPDIERSGVLATTAEAVMKSVYDKAVAWSATAVANTVGKSVGTVGAAAGGNVATGQRMAAARGWTGANWQALYNLWARESGWNHLADNPTSSAFGIAQALPGSKMASHGADWRTNPVTQIAWGLDYIDSRWGSPAAAWAFWQSHNWYGQGGIADAFARPKKFDNGGTLDRGWNLVRNATGRPERLARADGGSAVSFGERSIVVEVNAPVSPAQARVIGREIGRGASEAAVDGRVRERKVRLDARIAGG